MAVIVDARADRPYFERLGEALPRGSQVMLAQPAELATYLTEVGIATRGSRRGA